jgi:hypothetical protein
MISHLSVETSNMLGHLTVADSDMRVNHAAAATGASGNSTMRVTAYGAPDNCPPGGRIAHPTIHQQAGGTGTYDDPITFAGWKKAQPPGSRYYIHELQKYIIMEDDCEECEGNAHHIDLWIGPDSLPSETVSANIISCENKLTGSYTVESNPGHSYHVNTQPLFSAGGANGGCIRPITPCHDGNSDKCGNHCKVWKSGLNCDDLAKAFGLTPERFKALNHGLDCHGDIQKGTKVCMGGQCGG